MNHACKTALAALLITSTWPVYGAEVRPDEVHLKNLRQLTFSGENAEAYWSFDGKQLSLQATVPGQDRCDQIYLLNVGNLVNPLEGASRPMRRLLPGEPQGRSTCSFFLPDGERLLWSSTRHLSAECPPAPDRSQGYVWPLYNYQVYSARRDGSDVRRITKTTGYEAEATVCRDGSVVFTSDRDGDLELYRMKADGSGVRRLTFAAGYDGGAFFSEDCKRIVWRAARPRDDKEREEMKALWQRRLVRPTRMDLWVANADGTEAHAVTDLGAASFAPYFFPKTLTGSGSRRILFSSNLGDPKGREFDLWAINEDGTDLERISTAPEFDGFPMFSPDGKHLAFASNRGGKGRGETNVFIADWSPAGHGAARRTAADAALERVRYLTDPAQEGRGVGTAGLGRAAEEIARWMKAAGLAPAEPGGYFQEVEVFVGVRDAGSRFEHPAKDLVPAAMSESGALSGELAAAGYGITAPESQWDDLQGADVKGKVAVVLRGVPKGHAFKSGRGEGAAARAYSDLRYKAWNLREHGAAAVVFVDAEQDGVPPLKLDGPEGGAGLPVVFASRQLLSSLVAGSGDLLSRLLPPGGKKAVRFTGALRGTIALRRELRKERNVIGVLRGSGPGQRAVLLGAHYDHLGLGGRGSFVPDQRVVHPGADDNASGVAALLATAEVLRDARLPFDVYFAAFTGEEVGLVGSGRFVQLLGAKARERLQAMINFDMVGRLHGGPGSKDDPEGTVPAVVVQGTDSAKEWPGLLAPLCPRLGLRCRLGGDGYGPSDMTPFYAAGLPVLFFFTGAHGDYHRPSDTADKINALGVTQVAQLAAQTLQRLVPLTYQQPQGPAPRMGDSRGYGAYLGTIPDYTAMQGASGGVKLSGARPGSPAQQAGVQAGDVLQALGEHRIDTLEDMAFVLRQLKPGQVLPMVLKRGEQVIKTQVTVGRRPEAQSK